MKRTLINSCAAVCLLAAGTVSAGDKAAMIASALSAGPASVTDDATVKDHEGNVLKQGSNGYTCFPAAPTMGAACNQGQWNELIGAMMKKEDFTANQIRQQRSLPDRSQRRGRLGQGRPPHDDHRAQGNAQRHVT